MMCERALRVRWAILMVSMGALVCLAVGAREAPDQDTLPGVALLKQGATGMYLINVSYRMAEQSLAVREQVDFLLTPALLVQEAISDDVLLTYPEE
jgi:hypothetical protein